MNCDCPNKTWWSREVSPAGKRQVTFSRSRALWADKPFWTPCGQCIGCRLDHAKNWALRCMKERVMHDEACFVTLTYEKEPEGGTLVKRDLQLFMKRLRKFEKKAHSREVRFFACGEYGEKEYRPHYHALLFGMDFYDRRFYKKNGREDNLYTSAKLEEIWQLGLCTVGEVTFKSAGYCAGYVVKKVKGPDSWQSYQWIDASGVIYDRIPEFAVMSRRPGIATAYLEKYGKEVMAHDSVIVDGKEVKPPRFFDKWIERVDPDRFAELKLDRRREAHKNFDLVEFGPDRRRVKEIVKGRNLDLQQRTF